MVELIKNNKMKKVKTISLLLLTALISFTSTAQDRPNIIMIMADDLGGRDLEVYGNKFNESPNIDKLASQGMLFHNAYAAPVCSATRASIQSGQYPARNGIFDFIPGHWRPYEQVTVPIHKTQHLPEKLNTIGNAMQDAGYETAYFGKWHLGHAEKFEPQNRGYNTAHTYDPRSGFYGPEFSPEYKTEATDRLSDVLTTMSVDFMKENKKKPFFIFLSHYDVHVQLDGDKDLIEKYKKKRRDPDYPGNAVYAAMIEHIDRSVGTIMEAVEEEGLAENTIVIFYSDNGGVDNRFDNIPLLGGRSTDAYPDRHPLQYIATSNAPLRAGKGTLYEGGVRVPLIVKWPNKVKENVTTQAIVHSVDIYPTLVAIAKGKLPKKQVMDGHSMVPALTENKFDPEREVFTHYPVFHHDQPMSALRKGDWKIIENLVSGEFDLYNLKYDVNEMTDLKFSYPEKLTEMKTVLQKWQTNTGAPNPVPNPAFDSAKRYEWGKHPDRK